MCSHNHRYCDYWKCHNHPITSYPPYLQPTYKVLPSSKCISFLFPTPRIFQHENNYAEDSGKKYELLQKENYEKNKQIQQLGI